MRLVLSSYLKSIMNLKSCALSRKKKVPWNYFNMKVVFTLGFPYGYLPLRIFLQCRRLQFNSWVGKMPWRRDRLPTPVFLPGKFHGQRSLVGYSPCCHKEWNMNKQWILSLSRVLERVPIFILLFHYPTPQITGSPVWGKHDKKNSQGEFPICSWTVHLS